MEACAPSIQQTGGDHENRHHRRDRAYRIESGNPVASVECRSCRASPNSGVNTITGEGLAEALDGASVVVDVSNSPSFEDAAVLAFFETSTRNILAAEAAAGVGHHVALSVVATERLGESGYFRAKIAQEKLIRDGAIPYSIVHATQFFEFTKSMADAATTNGAVRVAPVLIQPMAADDVASAVSGVATAPPINGMIEIAGPEQLRMDDFVRRYFRAHADPRSVIADPLARYYGALLHERTLLPDNARLGAIRYEDWLGQSVPAAVPIADRAQKPSEDKRASVRDSSGAAPQNEASAP